MSPNEATSRALPRLPAALRTERLLLLPNHAMRARRCPKAILALWAWESALGAALTWPVAALVRGAYGSHPLGDAVLWEPGGLPLLDLLVRRRPALGALFAHTASVLLFAVVCGLLPLGAVLVSIGFTTPDRKAPSLRGALQSAIPAMGSFGVLLGTTLALEGSLLAATLVAAGLADQGFERKLGEVGAALVALAIGLLGLALVAIVGVIQDLARAAAVRYGSGAGQALRTALKTFADAAAPLVWSWAWRELASIVPVAFGALLASRLGGKRGIDLIVLLSIHQLIVAVRAALRVSWLAKAMRSVDAVGPA
jgi:hypothetical protein